MTDAPACPCSARLKGRKLFSRPLMVDLFCGLGGWAEGGIAEGYFVIGFDIERHEYDGLKYPGALVLQDVMTLDGAQFKDAALIVASPPCQAYSYRAMPWSRVKALPPPDNALFEACFRIQREACEAAGRHIPMVVENVRGAQKWVGRARWNFGSFYFWGDVPALMPMGRKFKSSGMNWSDQTLRGQDFTRIAGMQADGIKGAGGGADGWFGDYGIKQGGDWFNASQPFISRRSSSKSQARKKASALIAKIPPAVARHIARTYRP